MNRNKKPTAGIVGAFLVFAFLLIGVGSLGDDPANISDPGVPRPTAQIGEATSRPMASPTDTGNVKQPATPLEEFKGCVNNAGSDAEKRAVGHVTKLSGTEDFNGYLDMPKMFTDFDGGLTGPHVGEGVLIVSAFADCYKSDNGLVTVYDKNGDILVNGNF